MNIQSAAFVKGIMGTDRVTVDGRAMYAFVGRSNVGKSSLIQALTKRNDLVKVGKTPGKTTEANFFLINNKFYFVDLPGYGYAKLPPEMKERVKKLILWYLTDPEIKPKKVVVVLDVKAGVTTFDLQMLEILREQGHPFIVAVNKTDNVSQKELATQLQEITSKVGAGKIILCSAETRGGTEALLKALFE